MADSATTAGSAPTVTRETVDPSRRGFHVEIFLMSFAALLLEVSYTRIISFKLFYYYTYLVIGLALLGLGAGAVFVTISERIRRASTDAVLTWGFLAGALSVGVGYLVVARTPIDTLAIWDYGTRASVKNLVLLLVISFALFASFVAVGVMLATLFGRRPERIGRLYFADLVGAGLACAIVVSLLNTIGPPATIMLAGVVLAASGLRLAAVDRVRLTTVVAAVLVVVLAAPLVRSSWIPEPVDDSGKHLDGALGSPGRWSALFRVDAFQVSPESYLLFHDALIGSVIRRYDGDPSSLTQFDTDPRRFPFEIPERSPDDVMIIGAAGGNEVLASLRFGAEHIDAIELNPVTYDLVTDELADYAGRLAEDPRVNYVRGDGRSFLARSTRSYDLVWYPAPDSYSATNAATSGAFVLSESYLYTSETIRESLDHLRDGGIVVAQFGELDYDRKANRTSRYVSTVRHALHELGYETPERHIVVLTTETDPEPSSLSTVLVKKTPLTDAEIGSTLASLDVVADSSLRYAPGEPVGDDPATALASLPYADLDAWYDTYPYDVRPITDDAPFFWHFNTFRDVIAGFDEPIDRADQEDAVGERVLLLLLVIAALFAAAFLLLPFLAIRDTWRLLPRKRASALYFLALGLGFMFFEISLIQRLTLFLGYPTYSLTVTLASILIFTGIGALASTRVAARAREASVPLLGVLAVLTAFYVFALPELTDAFLGWDLAWRVAFAFAILAPLGTCLGMFMPLGIGAVAALSEHDREYVAWGWAVNGFASVIGAVLTTILAMTFGFRLVLLLALVVYAVAVLTLRVLLRPVAQVEILGG